jgi:hypothetical protein
MLQADDGRVFYVRARTSDDHALERDENLSRVHVIVISP